MPDTHPPPHPQMSADRFRECMEAANWNTEATSRALDLNRVTVQRFRTGAKPIPADVAAHMELVAGWHRAHPFVRGDVSRKVANLDRTMPSWRKMHHDNGAPQFDSDGTMLDRRGNRCIFDDVDC